MEAEGLKLAALFLDIVQSFFRDFLQLVAPNSVVAAGFAVATLICSTVGYIITGIIMFVYKLWQDDSTQTIKFTLLFLVQIFAGSLYMVGDNMALNLEEYFDELNCNGTCAEWVVSTGEAMLGLMLPLYFLSLIHKWVDTFTKKRNNRIPIPPLDALRLVIFAHEFDAIFTAIQRRVTEECTTPYHFFAWVLWVSYVFALGLATFLALTNVLKDSNLEVDDEEVWENRTIVTISYIHLALSIFLTATYLLADNSAPLGCSGNGNDVKIPRIILLWIPCILILIYIMVILVWKYWHSRNSEDDGEFLAFESGICPWKLTTFTFSLCKGDYVVAPQQSRWIPI